MDKPLNSLVSDIVNTLDPHLREDYEERAAIMEFDAELPRAHAECLALLDILCRHPSFLCGVTVLRIAVNDSSLWLMTTDIDRTRQHIAEIGAIEIGVSDLKEVIDRQFSGIAALASIK